MSTTVRSPAPSAVRTDPAYQASFLKRVPENARTLALADAWRGDSTP